jgi:putative ATPase
MPARKGPAATPLFDAPAAAEIEPGPGAPLAARMRPRTLDEFVGQGHLLAQGSVLRGLIEQDRLRSVLLYGPPGTGKTSLATLVARHTKAAFVQLSAVTAGVADVRRVVEEGKQRLSATGRSTVLFIDEVHRFNKAQQDALLPGVESGAIVFIGATTENPFFSVIGPLLSRSTLFRLQPLGPEQVRAIVARAVTDPEHGLAGALQISDDALDELSVKAEGDARVALNALEAAADRARHRGAAAIEMEDVEDAMRQRLTRYDRAGDKHYDVISAFIKSLRGSDPDAAVAWLARMVAAGEDPRFIARRMVILASEDIGLADNGALAIAVAAAQAVEYVGFPEAQLNLAHAAIALALAPKSNAVTRALGAANEDFERRGMGEVPAHLRDAHYKGAQGLGHGKDYKYPHATPEGWVDQVYMPEGFEGRTYWKPEERLKPRLRTGRDKTEEDER